MKTAARLVSPAPIALTLVLAWAAPTSSVVVLGYCGYIGGDDSDGAETVAVDPSGFAYVAGDTYSTGATFPVNVGPDLTFNPPFSGYIQDVFVAKVSADGTGLVYAGYIGGNSYEATRACAVDAGGSFYVSGVTSSSEATFPVRIGPDLGYNGPVPIATKYDSGDAFLAEVRPDGTGLASCGYIGGAQDDRAEGVAVDPVGNAYVSGWTNTPETSFPGSVGPDLTFNGGGTDVFIAKVRPDATRLVWAGYIGGDQRDDGGVRVEVNDAGEAYLSGVTESAEATFPVAIGPDLRFNGGGADAFVVRVKANGTGLLSAGYLGGDAADLAGGIALDDAPRAYIAGTTSSTEATFPVAVGPDPGYNGGSFDAFVARLAGDGASLEYCGYIGGSDRDQEFGVAVDPCGAAHVTGSTRSDENSFPVTLAPDLTYNGGIGDAFVAKVSPSGTGLEYAGYVGGSGYDVAFSVAVDAAGAAYVAGGTSSDQTTFPVTVGPDLTLGIVGDAFVAKVPPVNCSLQAAPIDRLLAIKGPAALDDVVLQWQPDASATDYNLWYVTRKDQIPLARQASSPPAIGVRGCAVPSPAPNPACTDPGAVSRDAPSVFFYQVRAHCCGVAAEGP